MSRYNDNDFLSEYLARSAASEKDPNRPAVLIPVTNGSYLVQDSDYQKDWNSLKTRNESLSQISMVVHEDKDLRRLVALASGQVMLSQLPRPQVGAIAPDFF